MPCTIKTTRRECGCIVSNWYAWSDGGLHDDGDTDVIPCAWHELDEEAFMLWLNRKPDQPDDLTYWRQVAQSNEDAYEDPTIEWGAWHLAAKSNRLPSTAPEPAF